MNAFASGTLPDRALIERLDRIEAENAAQRRSIDELKTLVLQILKNQQDA